jgi:uncharacterized membrane protein
MFCARCGESIPESEICPVCGRPAKLKLPMQVSPSPESLAAAAAPQLASAAPRNSRLKGVRGWLALFWVVITILSPARILVSVFSHPLHSWDLIDLGLVAFSLTIGTLILFESSGTIIVLRAYFITLIALAVLGIGTSLRDIDSPNGSNLALKYFQPLGFVVLWGAYFKYSERVRSTFGRNLF